MRFHQRPTDFVCVGDNVSQGSGGWQGAGADPCGGGFDSADLLVGFSQENQPDLLAWMDGDSGSPTGMPQAGCDLEIRGTGTTPLGGSLASAESYLDGVAASDSVAACRPYVVVLITDGAETCGGDPVGAANSLRLAGYTTYVVGFAVSDAGARADLDAIAAAGGGRPARRRGGTPPRTAAGRARAPAARRPPAAPPPRPAGAGRWRSPRSRPAPRAPGPRRPAPCRA